MREESLVDAGVPPGVSTHEPPTKEISTTRFAGGRGDTEKLTRRNPVIPDLFLSLPAKSLNEFIIGPEA